MAIDPHNTDAVAITQLDPLTPLSIATYLVGANEDGKMGNFTANELATFISPYVAAIGASSYIATTGTVLSNPTEKDAAFTFVGAGTFTQTTGGSITTTELLNILSWDGTTWSVSLEIPLNLDGYIQESDLNIIYKGGQIFDKSNPGIRIDTLVNPSTGALNTGFSGARTTYDIYITGNETKLSLSGILDSVTKCIAFKRASDTVVVSYTTNTTVDIPVGTIYYYLTFVRNVATTPTALDSFMLNYGASALPYSQFYGPFINKIIDQELEASILKGGAEIDQVGASGKSVINIDYFNVNIPTILGDVVRESDFGYSPIGLNMADPDDIVNGFEFNGSINALNPRSDDSVIWIKINPDTGYYLSGLPSGAIGNRNFGYYQSDKTTFISDGAFSAATLQGALLSPLLAGWVVITLQGRSNTATDFSQLMFSTGGSYVDFRAFEKGISSILETPIVASTSSLSTYGKKFLLFGDSITETLNVNGFARSNWPIFASTYLQWGSYSNYARSGASYVTNPAHTTPRQDMYVQVQDAIAAGENPDIIVIAAGTNDAITVAGSYAVAMGKATLNDLDKTLFWEAIRWVYWTIRITWPNAVVYSVLPLQRALYTTQELLPLYDAITKMAKEYNLRLIDATNESGVIRQTESVGVAGVYTVDGLHPNTFGQDLEAKLISKTILSSYL